MPGNVPRIVPVFFLTHHEVVTVPLTTRNAPRASENVDAGCSSGNKVRPGGPADQVTRAAEADFRVGDSDTDDLLHSKLSMTATKFAVFKLMGLLEPPSPSDSVVPGDS